MKNYLEIRNIFPFRSTFMFIDTRDYVTDELFFDHEIYGVRWDPNEFVKKDSDFVIIKCSIWTRDKDKFYDCMEHLRRKVEFLDCDMQEYDKLCYIFELTDRYFKGEDIQS